MSTDRKEDEVPVVKKDFKLFGKKISEITCFRNSFIFGICSGVAGGLLTFLFTSKARLSSHVAFGSLWVGVFSYWIPCRIRYENSVLVSEKWKQTYSRSNIMKKKGESSSSPSPNQSE